MVNLARLIAVLIMRLLKILWFIYCAPGYVFIWVTYYFPTEWGSKRDVARGARQWRKRDFFAPFWSSALLVFILFMMSS